MIRYWRMFLLALLTGCALAFPSALYAQAAPAERDWTVMVYMNGKNSLEADALNNFHAMASVGSTDRVAIVAELGRPRKHYNSGDGNWSGVFRFLVSKDQQPRPASAVERVPAGLGSDMGKPDTLATFLSWAKAKYPARHYMVIVWNHGQGYRLLFSRLMAKMSTTERSMFQATPSPPAGTIGGFRAVSSDDDTRSILYNAEVAGALSQSFSPTDKLDLLGFDACLMSMMETAYALDLNVRLMVGSEELEPGDGWQYKDWLSRLVANPSMSPEYLGRAVVDTYGAHFGDSYYTTLSLLDLSRTRAAAAALTGFSDALRASGPGELQLMRAARNDVSAYGDWETPPFYLSIDLTTLLNRYKARTSNVALAAKADTAIAATAAMVIDNYASARSRGAPGAGLYGSQGVAIYYPSSAAAFRGDPFHPGYFKANTDRPVAFVRDEHWADLLYDLLGIH